MKNALFLCALLVTASAIKVYPSPNPDANGKGVESQPAANAKPITDDAVVKATKDAPFVQCSGSGPCRVLLDIEAGDPKPVIQGTQDPDKPDQFVKVELRCCVVALPFTLDNCPKDAALLFGESDWVLIQKEGFNDKYPISVGITVPLPASNINSAYQQTEKCQIAIKQRRTNVGGVVVEASNPVNPSDAASTPAFVGYLRVDFIDTNAVMASILAGRPSIDITSSTFQQLILSIPKTYHDQSAGSYFVSVQTDSPNKNILLSLTGQDGGTDKTLEIANNLVTCNEPTKCTLKFYVKRVTVTQSAKFGVQQAASSLVITHGEPSSKLTFPITNSLLFAAAAATQAPTALAPGAIISVNGETGVASQASLQNRTVVVESVHATNVPDDEYSGVSAGIVYAAVGSAFVFVCVLGLIAAKLGSKAALKGV